MTLKPSKKKHNKKNNKTKKNKKEKKKQKKQEKNKKYSKMSFSVISENFLLFWLGVQNFPFLQLGPKSAHTKNTIKIVVSGPFFLKSSCASRNGHFWTKKSQIHKFQLSFFFACFLLFQQHKTQKMLKPLFL